MHKGVHHRQVAVDGDFHSTALACTTARSDGGAALACKPKQDGTRYLTVKCCVIPDCHVVHQDLIRFNDALSEEFNKRPCTYGCNGQDKQ